ncbi:hypothetical protein [Desulfotalea psychrophila]|uniref:hypothetical protein n=1 Tax=Desulfotalea psychrophila TaxID=84980 RepID=UPI0002DD2F01|nr:hypothetical protein [Desulfotalea psychrophila]
MATSLIIGEVMRKATVIPTGMRAAVKPRKRGMLLQLQNGVIEPKKSSKKVGDKTVLALDVVTHPVHIKRCSSKACQRDDDDDQN